MLVDSPVCLGLEAPDEMSSCSCSNSSDHAGDNSRRARGIRLFGVDLLSEGVMRKSVSLGNLAHYSGSSSNLSVQEHSDQADGYLSDGLVHTNSNARARRKGVPWTEEEHRLFLVGLQKLGKGDWRGISKAFVTTRTPTQVASHAQKYFIRQSNLSKRKRRSSLFDISPGHDSSLPDISTGNLPALSPFLELGLGHERIPVSVAMAPPLEKIMEERVFLPEQEETGKLVGNLQAQATMANLVSAPSVPSTPPLWLGLSSQANTITTAGAHEAAGLRGNVVKPIPSISTGPVRIDDSELSLGFAAEPSLLSLKLEEPVRHSAFHVSASFGNGNMASGGGLKAPIQCT